MRLGTVVDCDMCGGRGLMLAERVPAGGEIATGTTTIRQQAVRCPRCNGKGARIITEARS